MKDKKDKIPSEIRENEWKGRKSGNKEWHNTIGKQGGEEYIKCGE